MNGHRFVQRLFSQPLVRFALLSALIVAAVFPDVIFKNASISILDQANFQREPRSAENFYHERPGLAPQMGFFDTGGAAGQSEPAIQFMKNSIYGLQSPFWNPYSGAGSFGPETMVDIKLSPLSLLVAILGGSNLAFHIVTLLFYTLALFFLFRVLVEQLNYGLLPAVAAGAVFLLNGYFTANLSSNTNQALLYFPFCVFASLNFARRPDAVRFLVLVFACVLPLSVSFFPTTVLMMTTLVVSMGGCAFQYRGGHAARLKLFATLLAAPVLAGMVLMFFYLPLSEALSYVGGMDLYGARVFCGSEWRAIISLFSSKHFFESYNAINPVFYPLIGNVIFHLGVLAGLIAAIGIVNPRISENAFTASLTLLLLFTLGRIFAIPLISNFFDFLPFLRNVAVQYWWMVIGCTFPFVFAYGFNLLQKAGQFRVWPVYLVGALLVADLVYIGKVWGFKDSEGGAYVSPHRAMNYVGLTVFLIFAACGLIAALKRRPANRRAALIGVLTVAVFAEMIHYFDTSRLRREDIFLNPPAYVTFLKNHVGLNRIANYGSYGLPPELGSAYQIQQVEFFTMNIFPSYYQFCQRNDTTEHGWWGKDTFCVNRDTTSEPNINESALNLLSVRYIVISESAPKFRKFFEDRKYPIVFQSPVMTIFENLNSYPRIFAVPHLVEAPLTPETKGLDARNVAFTEDQKLLETAKAAGVRIGAPEASQPSPLFTAGRITSYQNTKVGAEVDLPSAGVVALMDNWHPNWQVTVDGKGAYLGKINESFRGVAVGPGHHVIMMSYCPKTLPLGLGITVSTLLGLGLLAVFRRRVNRFLSRFLTTHEVNRSQNEIYNAPKSALY